MAPRRAHTRHRAGAVAFAVLAGLVASGCGSAPNRGLEAPSCAPLSVASGSQSSNGGGPVAPSTASQSLVIRVNQVGYEPGCSKVAVVMARRALRRPPSFAVLALPSGRQVLAGTAGPARGAWSATWRAVYPIDFSSLRTPGRYLVAAGTVRSPSFSVASARTLYAPLADATVRFFEEQRDGAEVIRGALGRLPSHLQDRRAQAFGQPVYHGTTLSRPLVPTGARVNAAGGWFDAGDYLKFVETASFSDALMLLTLRDYAARLPVRSALDGEARFGLDWLMRMWDPRNGILYYQVGIGDGNGSTILGDHDLWRLPQADEARNARPGQPAYYVEYRPVFAANRAGQPIPPNLAGRVAGVFGLCAQLYANSRASLARACLRDGQAIYSRAELGPHAKTLSASPSAYYLDPEWHDDMEFGAIELYLGLRAIGGAPASTLSAARYVADAGAFANAYIASPTDGVDSLNLYDISALAHFDLARVLRDDRFINHIAFHVRGNNINIPTDVASLEQDFAGQLALATRLAAGDRFRLADTSTNLDTVPHALGYSIQARLYDLLSGRRTYEDLARTELGWVLGTNAWGSSFVVGTGSTYPHCLSHQVANLSGSLDGSSPLLTGATVDGPTAPSNLTQLGAPDGFRPCPPASAPTARFSAFDSATLGYRDDVTSFATSEPSDDFTALALLAFAQAASAR